MEVYILFTANIREILFQVDETFEDFSFTFLGITWPDPF